MRTKGETFTNDMIEYAHITVHALPGADPVLCLRQAVVLAMGKRCDVTLIREDKRCRISYQALLATIEEEF